MFNWLSHLKTIETHHVLINLYLFQTKLYIFAGPVNKAVDLIENFCILSVSRCHGMVTSMLVTDVGDQMCW